MNNDALCLTNDRCAVNQKKSYSKGSKHSPQRRRRGRHEQLGLGRLMGRCRDCRCREWRRRNCRCRIRHLHVLAQFCWNIVERHTSPRISGSRTSALRTRDLQYTFQLWFLKLRVINGGAERVDRRLPLQQFHRAVLGGNNPAALLVATLGVLLCIFGYTDHERYTNSVDSSECLRSFC